MLFAQVGIVRSQASPGGRGICPVCGSEVIAKCGLVNVWHWSHRSKSTCDPWAEHETDWHLGWKTVVAAVAPDCVEKIISKNGQIHRADICLPGGEVIELQHSPLSADEIWERQRFYGKMTWIFDIRDCVKRHRFITRTKPDYVTFRWKHPRSFIRFAAGDVYLDLGNRLLLLRKLYTEHRCSGWGNAVSREVAERALAALAMKK